MAREPRPALRRATRAYFERELSFAALGGKLRATYLDLLAQPAAPHT